MPTDEANLARSLMSIGCHYSLLVCLPRHYPSSGLSKPERRDGSSLCEIKDPT